MPPSTAIQIVSFVRPGDCRDYTAVYVNITKGKRVLLMARWKKRISIFFILDVGIDSSAGNAFPTLKCGIVWNVWIMGLPCMTSNFSGERPSLKVHLFFRISSQSPSREISNFSLTFPVSASKSSLYQKASLVFKWEKIKLKRSSFSLKKTWESQEGIATKKSNKIDKK